MILDASYVQNYFDQKENAEKENAEKEEENVSNIAGKENESVIDLDALEDDDSIEYVGSSIASPRTKKIASMSKQIYLLENQIAGMKKEKKAKQNLGNQSNASASSIEPQSSTSSASTSSSSLNSTDSMGDINISDLGGFDEEEVNKLVDEWHANGQLFDLANDVVDFCLKQ